MTEFNRGKTYIVDRGAPKLRYGQGMASGLGVVIRHFRDALTKKLDNASETSGVFTVQYPEERLPLPEAFRNFPILLYDDASGQELCTSCFQCERICPPQVIHITQAKDPATGKPVPAAAEFVIEYDACMSCNLCAEVCPFDAIKMDHEFELATDEHGGLTIDKEGLNRPVSYYEQLAPTFWAEARANAYKKLQGTLKRRSGLIGVAPQMAERVAATLAADAETAYQRAAGAAPPPSDDKAARLAAIRARNAAKNAAPATPADPETEYKRAAGASPAETPPPAGDKAARLAAIRARNAAKKDTADGVPLSDERRMTNDEAPADAETAYKRVAGAAPTTPVEDKAARLAAIRAANAAKKAPTDGIPEAPEAPQPAEDKAARLAAIRAANAAKKAAPAVDEGRTPVLSAVEGTNDEAPSVVPADDKAARLAAIRAANAAKKAAQNDASDDSSDEMA